MEKIIKIEKRKYLDARMAIIDIDYSKDKPYLLKDVLRNEIGNWVDLEEIRKIKPNVEDYNVTLDSYRKHYKLKNISDMELSEFKRFLKNPKAHLGEDDTICNMIGLELEGMDIELQADRNECSEKANSFGVFFDFITCLKFGEGENDWETYDYSDYVADLEELKNLHSEEDVINLLFSVLLKTARDNGLYISKINNQVIRKVSA